MHEKIDPFISAVVVYSSTSCFLLSQLDRLFLSLTCVYICQHITSAQQLMYFSEDIEELLCSELWKKVVYYNEMQGG
jgi:hypothetical protein